MILLIICLTHMQPTSTERSTGDYLNYMKPITKVLLRWKIKAAHEYVCNNPVNAGCKSNSISYPCIMGLMDFESRKSMDHPAPLASPINNDPCVAHWISHKR